MSLNEKK
jgi:DNA-directed RNA polymerase I subunit RPA2